MIHKVIQEKKIICQLLSGEDDFLCFLFNALKAFRVIILLIIIV